MVDPQTEPAGPQEAYRSYARQKCFLGYSQKAPWAPDLLAAAEEVLSRPRFDLDLDYAGKHFEPGVPLRQKAVELVANARYGLYDLSWWQDPAGAWQMPRNVLIELGIAIVLNRPTLLLRHGSNAPLELPHALSGLQSQLLEFSGQTTLKRSLEKRLPQWIDAPPERDWWNRFCLFGGRVCKHREAHPQARQLSEAKIRCLVIDGCEPDRLDFRSVVDEVLTRFSDVEHRFLDSLEAPQGFEFLLCSLCQQVRSTPLAIFRISAATPPETFLALGMALGLESHFGYPMQKVLLTESHHQVPSLLAGYEVVEARNDGERKKRLKLFLPGVLRAVRRTVWKPRPLPFFEAGPVEVAEELPMPPEVTIPEEAAEAVVAEGEAALQEEAPAREAEEAEPEAEAEGLLAGQTVKGIVTGLTSESVIVQVGDLAVDFPHQDFTALSGDLSVGRGDEVELLVEEVHGDGAVDLAVVKASREELWEEIEQAYQESAVIQGRVMDRIKGGLTVDVGLRAFLPGSLTDLRPVKNLEGLRGQQLHFKIISLDRRRNTIVLSRKAVLEKESAALKAETVKKLVEGARLSGVVKNLTDYGLFVDLGGIDGLIHITDITWGRINHPSERFAVGDEIEAVVLKYDPDSERVSLGTKQLTPDPWTLVEKRYPVGRRLQGEVVSLVDYGAFLELEEGVEGLIHVSEMSWTKKVVNPARVLAVGDRIEAVVIELDLAQRRILLSLRQTQKSPWQELADILPVGSLIEGKVTSLNEFGAFVEVAEGIEGLVHISDMSWTTRAKNPREVVELGETVRARITNIDIANQRVSLSMKEFMANEWDEFESRYAVGDSLRGRVVRVYDFGLFVDLYQGIEGLVHISEMSQPEGTLKDLYQGGQWVGVRVLRIDQQERRVGLGMRGVPQPGPEEIAELERKARELKKKAREEKPGKP